MKKVDLIISLLLLGLLGLIGYWLLRLRKPNQSEQNITIEEAKKHPGFVEILEALDQNEDVRAVKIAREQFGLSLLAGKRFVDEVKSQRNDG